MINKLIGDNLKFLREREKKSMGRLAKAIGIDKQKIAKMEYGKSIDVETLLKLADFYSVDIKRIATEDLSKTDKIVTKIDNHIQKDNKPVEIISKKDIPANENIGKALECAKSKDFNCPYYNGKNPNPPFDYCFDCYKAEFWNKKDLALDLQDSKVEDVIPEGEDYHNCPMFQMNPNPNCYLRNIHRANLPMCYYCLRDVDRWGEQAIGYSKNKKNK